jgi:regulator of protease activity HflC (stomatin/prohibitin superfamily)
MLAFMRAAPTTYVLHWQRGRLRREGPGLAFFYFAPTSTIAAVPLASTDVPFAFSESTADFQAVTLQGTLTFRVADPRQLARVLDYSIRANGRYVSDDPDKLPERLLQAAQVLARASVERLPLRQALASSDAIVGEVLAGLRRSEVVLALGVEILGFAVLAIKPTPEIARALEAEAREALQRRSDEAIYARRNAAVAGAENQGERARDRGRGAGEAAPDPGNPDRRRHCGRGAARCPARPSGRERPARRGRPCVRAQRHPGAPAGTGLAHTHGRGRRERRSQAHDRARFPRAS